MLERKRARAEVIWICIRLCRESFFLFLMLLLLMRAFHDVNRQILLREGMLSPNSKVLTSMASCASLSIPMGGRESVASNVTAGECMIYFAD